ncbi:MAG: Eco57I restriction-modification methylase domain-containing protein [Opitutaceae bacterium]|jgi:hypothetical protein
MRPIQVELFDASTSTKDAVAYFSEADAESRGAIHTRPEVAEFILNLMGWQTEAPLTKFRLLEPSAGEGDFLIPAVRRLLTQAKPDDLRISTCIRAVEVNLGALAICRERLHGILSESGWSRIKSEQLLSTWLVHADFLTLSLPAHFTHIVGNPPYLRLESLPKDLLRLYRSQWTSLFDRADLYVAFIEKSLGLLATNGLLGFICADRWMKNRYGGPLRELVSASFHLEAYVDFTGCPAFFNEVDAYPAVTVFRRGQGSKTYIAFRPDVSEAALIPLSKALRGEISHPAVSVRHDVTKGDQSWAFDEDGCMDAIRQLENTLPALEAAGARVGIGVATGADAVFIGRDLDVEDSRKLPLATTRDIRSGRVEWRGDWVLNPFESDGRLVELAAYPRFAAYLEKHRSRIQQRNVAARNPSGWFRTIDRIHESLTWRPKLLIPDIKGSAHVVYEEGMLYPHHNLYHITSETWELRALQTVLSSRLALAFIVAYSPRMRGGNLRFQAQYLRRIRIPEWTSVGASLREKLTKAALTEDTKLADAAVRELYGFDNKTWDLLGQARQPSTNTSSLK